MTSSALIVLLIMGLCLCCCSSSITPSSVCSLCAICAMIYSYIPSGTKEETPKTSTPPKTPNA